MSTKRKKKEIEKVPEPVYKGSNISIDRALTGRFRRVGRNPLDDALESEDAMMARDFKTMRVEEANMKRKVKMAKLQKEIDKIEKEGGNMPLDSSDMPKISVAMAQQIANLPEAERNKVIETYAMFRSMDQSKGRGDSLLPLLIGFSKSNPGNQQGDMATYAKAMSDQFQSGIAVMQSVTAKEKPSNATELLKIFSSLVEKSMVKPIEDLTRNMTAQPSAFEQILMNPEMFSRAKEIGMFGSRESSGGSTNIDLEIEKLRGERELSIKQMDLGLRKTMLEIEANNQRTDNILAALSPLAALATPLLSQRMGTLGEQQARTHTPPSNPQTVTPPSGTTILIKCNCGHEGPVNFPGEVPSIIKCPSCNNDLVVGGAPTGKAP